MLEQKQISGREYGEHANHPHSALFGGSHILASDDADYTTGHMLSVNGERYSN